MAKPTKANKTPDKGNQAERKLANPPTVEKPARGQGTSLANENLRLRRRVEDLTKELQSCRARLGETFAREVGAERLLAREFVATEIQHGDLASLYVAGMRLHSTLTRPDLLAAIREIVINLIGGEEMALFEIDPWTSTLSLVDCCGNGAVIDANVRIGEGPIGRAAMSGESYINAVKASGRASHDEGLPLACIPLKVDGDVWGLIVIFRLLPQKDHLLPLDYQLFDLLSAQAGIALHCAKLNAGRRAGKECIP